MADITSVNAVYVISVPLILPVSQQLQGFSADDIYGFEEVSPNEVMMGLDGALSGGKVFVAKPQTITLMAGSASISFFDAWNEGMEVAIIAAPAFATLTLPSVGKSYQMSNGFLTRYKPAPDGKKVLQPQQYTITWNSVVPIPVGLSG